MRKIFISYDYSNDREYKNLLVAWDKNKRFDFDFNDTSTDISIDSNDHSVIKRVISSKIKQSDIFLCLIGKYTNKSQWVKWEIEKALELKKKIVAVKIEKGFESPNEIKDNNAEWAMSFNFDSIKEAIEKINSPTFTINKGAGPKEEKVNPPPPWCP